MNAYFIAFKVTFFPAPGAPKHQVTLAALAGDPWEHFLPGGISPGGSRRHRGEGKPLQTEMQIHYSQWAELVCDSAHPQHWHGRGFVKGMCPGTSPLTPSFILSGDLGSSTPKSQGDVGGSFGMEQGNGLSGEEIRV